MQRFSRPLRGLSAANPHIGEHLTTSTEGRFFLPPACAVSDSADDPLAQRIHPEPAHPYRTAFQRDRARVIHSRAFRRLAGKTQVFTHRYSDHFRSRLTHTMEVAQIARAIAAALGLNDDLTEALALAHDIGHPPFGHTGERALDEAMRAYGLRFDHNLHALRIVEYFEVRYAAFRGLNLTLGLREGIVKHSRDYSVAENPELRCYFLDQRPPLEAQIIDLADEIAYITADMEDGYEAGMLEIDDIRSQVAIFDRCFGDMEQRHAGAPLQLQFNEAIKRVLNELVSDLIAETSRRVRAGGITTVREVRGFPERLVSLSAAAESLRSEAKQYLYHTLYSSNELSKDVENAGVIVRDLFSFWMEHPERLPDSCRAEIEGQGLARVIGDHIAGMTDHYILAQHKEHCA